MSIISQLLLVASLLLQPLQGALLNGVDEVAPEGADDDMGMILYVDGVPRVGTPVMRDLCRAAAQTVESMACISIWSDGAFMKSIKGDPITDDEKETILEVLQQKLTSKEETQNGVVNLEPNLEVVEGSLMTQNGAPLNLGRLDQKTNAMDNVYKYRTTGKGVTVYVLDKGINKNHWDFKYRDGRPGTRVTYGTTSFTSDASCAGHGTHVAGIVGGLKYGVAKDVEIVMVQVQPCKEKGSVQYLLSGMDWVLDNVKRPAVAQMSLLALGKSYSLNRKVQQLIDANIPFVLSAGNYANDACFYSPAMVPSTIVVGNVGADDRINKYSNYGTCVDLFAPGASIRSASSTSNTMAAVMTGTSQAAPHVSGVVAQFLEREPYATIETVMSVLLSTAAKDYIEDPKGSPNFILQTDLSPKIETTTASIEFPGISVTPREVPPVNLFQSEGPGTEEALLSIANELGGQLVYNITIDALEGSDIKQWLSISKYNGSLAAGEVDEIDIVFKTENVHQGAYQADLLIHSNDPDKPTHTIQLSMRLFCERVAKANKTGSFAEMHDAKVTQNRPSAWGPEPPMGEPPSLYLDAILSLDYPVLNDDPDSLFPQISQALSVTRGGFLDLVEDNDYGGNLCSSYHIRARAPRQDVWSGTNEVCITIEEEQIVDVFRNRLPGTEVCEAYNDRPEAKLFGAYMMYSSDQGLFTAESNIKILIAFSEQVRGVEDAQFYVEIADGREARTYDTKRLEGSKTFYEALVAVPDDFFGKVKVSMRPGIADMSGKALRDVQPLSFMRFKKSIIQHTSFNVRDEL